MLLINFICIFYLSVLVSCRTISKSVQSPFDGFDDYALQHIGFYAQENTISNHEAQTNAPLINLSDHVESEPRDTSNFSSRAENKNRRHMFKKLPSWVTMKPYGRKFRSARRVTHYRKRVTKPRIMTVPLNDVDVTPALESLLYDPKFSAVTSMAVTSATKSLFYVLSQPTDQLVLLQNDFKNEKRKLSPTKEVDELVLENRGTEKKIKCKADEIIDKAKATTCTVKKKVEDYYKYVRSKLPLSKCKETCKKCHKCKDSCKCGKNTKSKKKTKAHYAEDTLKDDKQKAHQMADVSKDVGLIKTMVDSKPSHNQHSSEKTQEKVMKQKDNNATKIHDRADATDHHKTARFERAVVENEELPTTSQSNTSSTRYDALVDKLSYKDFVKGYKYYLDFEKSMAKANFSDMVNYQAHRQHSVDDIGKFILEKIPQFPTDKNYRSETDGLYESIDRLPRDDYMVTKKMSWWKKYFRHGNGKCLKQTTVLPMMPMHSSSSFRIARDPDLGRDGTQLQHIFDLEVLGNIDRQLKQFNISNPVSVSKVENYNDLKGRRSSRLSRSSKLNAYNSNTNMLRYRRNFDAGQALNNNDINLHHAQETSKNMGVAKVVLVPSTEPSKHKLKHWFSGFNTHRKTVKRDARISRCNLLNKIKEYLFKCNYSNKTMESNNDYDIFHFSYPTGKESSSTEVNLGYLDDKLSDTAMSPSPAGYSAVRDFLKPYTKSPFSNENSKLHETIYKINDPNLEKELRKIQRVHNVAEYKKLLHNDADTYEVENKDDAKYKVDKYNMESKETKYKDESKYKEDAKYKVENNFDAKYKIENKDESKYKELNKEDAKYKVEGKEDAKYEVENKGDAKYKVESEDDAKYRPESKDTQQNETKCSSVVSIRIPWKEHTDLDKNSNLRKPQTFQLSHPNLQKELKKLQRAHDAESKNQPSLNKVSALNKVESVADANYKVESKEGAKYKSKSKEDAKYKAQNEAVANYKVESKEGVKGVNKENAKYEAKNKAPKKKEMDSFVSLNNPPNWKEYTDSEDYFDATTMVKELIMKKMNNIRVVVNDDKNTPSPSYSLVSNKDLLFPKTTPFSLLVHVMTDSSSNNSYGFKPANAPNNERYAMWNTVHNKLLYANNVGETTGTTQWKGHNYLPTFEKTDASPDSVSAKFGKLTRRAQRATDNEHTACHKSDPDVAGQKAQIEKRETGNIHMVKNVAALEILLDSENNEIPTRAPEGLLNAIQIHITLPKDENKKKLRSVGRSVKKLFSARMVSPVDMVYSVISKDEPVKSTTSAPASRLSPGVYLLVQNCNASAPSPIPKDCLIVKLLSNNIDLSKVMQRNFEITESNKEEIHQTTPKSTFSKVTLSKDFVSVVNQHLEQLFEALARNNRDSIMDESTKLNQVSKVARSVDLKDVNQNFTTLNDSESEFKKNLIKVDGIKKGLSWNLIKKYFSDSKANDLYNRSKRLSNTNSTDSVNNTKHVDDTVVTGLISEMNNLVQYMHDHCTEVQTFFWMNPSGGRKLRDTVKKVDKLLDNMSKKVKRMEQKSWLSCIEKYINSNFNNKSSDDDTKKDIIALEHLTTSAYDTQTYIDFEHFTSSADSAEKYPSLLRIRLTDELQDEDDNSASVSDKYAFNAKKITIHQSSTPNSAKENHESVIKEDSSAKVKVNIVSALPSKNESKSFERRQVGRMDSPLKSDAGGLFWSIFIKNDGDVSDITNTINRSDATMVTESYSHEKSNVAPTSNAKETDTTSDTEYLTTNTDDIITDYAKTNNLLKSDITVNTVTSDLSNITQKFATENRHTAETCLAGNNKLTSCKHFGTKTKHHISGSDPEIQDVTTATIEFQLTTKEMERTIKSFNLPKNKSSNIKSKRINNTHINKIVNDYKQFETMTTSSHQKIITVETMTEDDKNTIDWGPTGRTASPRSINNFTANILREHNHNIIENKKLTTMKTTVKKKHKLNLKEFLFGHVMKIVDKNKSSVVLSDTVQHTEVTARSDKIENKSNKVATTDITPIIQSTTRTRK